MKSLGTVIAEREALLLEWSEDLKKKEQGGDCGNVAVNPRLKALQDEEQAWIIRCAEKKKELNLLKKKHNMY